MPLRHFSLLILFTFLLASASVFGQTESVIFPNASWEIEQSMFPGTYVLKASGSGGPIQEPVAALSTLKVNQHMDRLIIEHPAGTYSFTKVCKDDVSLMPIPNVDVSNVRKNLTAWKTDTTIDGANFKAVIFEQPGGGVFVGTGISDNPWSLSKGMITLSPVEELPDPPRVESEPDLPEPDVAKERGIHALARKLAEEYDRDVEYFKKFIFASGTSEGALLVQIWLDDNNQALPAEREVKDPCDPRYGNMKAAKKLFVVKIIRLEDGNGISFYANSRLIDVETGIIRSAFNPESGTPSSYNLYRVVSEVFDGLQF